MPHGDHKGPEGKGSKTGRQMGICSGNDEPGDVREGTGLRGGSRDQGARRRCTDEQVEPGGGRGAGKCRGKGRNR